MAERLLSNEVAVRGRVIEEMKEPKLSVSFALNAKFALTVSTEEDC
jgi:hypothetical protein